MRWPQALRFCPTGHEALEVLTRYVAVSSAPATLRLLRAGDEVAVTVATGHDAMDRGLAAESALALGVRLLREAHGFAGPRRVEFEYPLHGPLEAYESFFDAQVRPEAGRNAVVFAAADLDRQPRPADPTMYRYVQAHLDLARRQLLARVTDEPLDSIRRVVAEQGQQGRFDVESIARAAGMSVRTLQRHVSKHGASVRGLIDEVRHAQATRLLQDPRLSVEEVAFLVGYADDRAFRRAFKRWTGTTPAAHRASTP